MCSNLHGLQKIRDRNNERGQGGNKVLPLLIAKNARVLADFYQDAQFAERSRLVLHAIFPYTQRDRFRAFLVLDQQHRAIATRCFSPAFEMALEGTSVCGVLQWLGAGAFDVCA